MLVLRVACDNIFMFRNFEIDFTYERGIRHPLSRNDTLFEGSRIKVRKNLIMMGANASGKTTFGKLLCAIFNYIYGKNLDDGSFKLADMWYDKSRNFSFEMEFALGRTAYLLKAEFSSTGLQREEVRKQRIFKSYNIMQLRRRLYSGEEVTPSYDAAAGAISKVGFQSYVFSAYHKSKECDEIRRQLGFWFRFSEFQSNSQNYSGRVNVEFLNEILPKIDNSILGVKRLYADDDGAKTLTNTYQIYFRNDETLTVADGDLNRCERRLSHGTFEVIDFVSFLNELMKGNSTLFFYIDENLSHIHTELEAYLIRKAFVQNRSSQIFFTTHNTDIFELNVPTNSFVFFRRNADGFNESMYPASVLNKGDRALRGYYENDYFGVLPDYSVLDSFFENMGVQRE